MTTQVLVPDTCRPSFLTAGSEGALTLLSANQRRHTRKSRTDTHTLSLTHTHTHTHTLTHTLRGGSCRKSLPTRIKEPLSQKHVVGRPVPQPGERLPRKLQQVPGGVPRRQNDPERKRGDARQAQGHRVHPPVRRLPDPLLLEGQNQRQRGRRPDHLPRRLRVQAGEPVHHGTRLRAEVQGRLQEALLLDAGEKPRPPPAAARLSKWPQKPQPVNSQEPKTDKDEEYCRKVNEYLNNPPIPGAPGSGGSGGHELSALGGEGGLQNLLGNMSHNQLMQLIGPTGLGGLGLGALAGPGLANLLGSSGPATSSSSSSSRSQSAAATPSSGGAPRLSSTQAPTTPVTPAASAAPPASVTPSTPAAAQTPLVPASVGSPTSHQPIQLSDLQSILATMNVPATGGQGSAVDLASICSPEMMAPILANAEVQQRLLPFLPSGESLPQSADEIQNTLSSPQFQQAMGMFSSALASGQLGPLMSQFGLPAEAVDAANRGDVEAFARAMQASKEKKEDEEDMSLD